MLSNLYKVKIRDVAIFALFVYSLRIVDYCGREYWATNISDIHEYREYREYRNFRENNTKKIVKMPHNLLSQQNIGAPIWLAYA